MNMLSKTAVKRILGELPLSAELYWQLRQSGKPISKSFSLQRTEEWLPQWRSEAEAASGRFPSGKRVLLFATLRYWIEHAVLMGLALGGLGHQVRLAYLPYANWRKPLNRFDLRRQIAYSQNVLEQTGALLDCISLTDARARSIPENLPAGLLRPIEAVSGRDVQYTLQVEEVDPSSELYNLRIERNRQAAAAVLALLQGSRPDVIVTPNGSILEFGAIYQVARYLGIPIVTYEFGEQRERIWLAQNSEVMRQETDALWQARKDAPLRPEQVEQARALFTSRQRADLWENFSRRWQGLPSQGEDLVRATVGLDSRPVVLLAANVIGDSLTLGRQVFTASMTEWLQRTVTYFSTRPDVQLTVRIHPGERYTTGPSVADVVHQVLPEPPEHIHLVAADDPINTYDLIDNADFGLVYTTTVGMEMAMSGVPVVVAGKTHYRGRGFTHDPDTWHAYHALLERGIGESGLTHEQVDLAWNYAYRFFFEFPQPFPWHLLHFWDELQEWPVRRVLDDRGQALFGDTFRYLTGDPIDWAVREGKAL
jgi:hypothetical protein